MKKILALLLALVMTLALCACGSTTTETDTTETTDDTTAAETETVDTDIDPDDIPDTMDSTDGTYEVAFVTDVGELKDKSFNQGTYDGVKLYAYQNGLTYKYYAPANGDEATDDDRYDAMKAAVDGGAKVVVCAGYLHEGALTRAATDFPETKFVFIDGYTLYNDAGEELTNVAGIAFKEEQSGYFAGYAVVKEGLTQLGFAGGGGGTNPACSRYGYGFVQGANAAAAEMGVQVELTYSWEYGSNYSSSPELQTMLNGWYENGIEAIFVCGGRMCESAFAAASANDGYVVGVDVDQSSESDTVLTSAMKGLSDAVEWAVAKYYDGAWDEIGGTITSLGAQESAVGLPTDTWALENYSVEEYEEMLQAVSTGEMTIDDDYETNLTQDYSNLTLNII